jgi:4-amino-4-deoxy-L-arabinose transferase-like glycosyltransferase
MWVALLSMVWLAATAWIRPLMLPDEGRYVGVAWEMLRSGDWLTPTLNGLPYFHKPPLFYWITAGSLSLFGLNEWAARAAPLLGAGLGALAPYFFVRRWADERSARLALIALLVQPLFYIGGQFANLDMLVAGCITATIVLLAHAALSIERGLPYRHALVGAYIFAAAGVLAKGLIGAVIPALVIGAWLVTLRRWQGLRALIWAPGVAIFVAIVGPWFVAMQQRFADFLDYFFVVQQFKRFAAGGFNNVQPFWFYPAVLLLFSLPWLPWLARIVRRGYLTHRDGDGLDARGPIRWLMLLWTGVVVVFFSLPQSKLLGYVLPAVPPLAVLMADALTGLGATSRRAVRLWWTSAAVSAVVSVGAVAALVIDPLHSSRDLGRALAAQRSQSDAVFMLGNYYFDVPFYARLRDVITVVEAWDSPDVPLRDNWRKELADASAFAPARSAARLVTPVMLPAALCLASVDWVIGPSTAVNQYPVLALARVVFRQRDTTLWRLDSNQPQVASALRCSGTPNDG